jgi:hypothetical protein
MAGLKTPSKKKRDSSKPSPVLVIFLVFFIIVSIGLGVWGYYGYAGQDKLESTAKERAKSADVAKDFELYALFIANEARLAIGSPDQLVDAPLYAEKREEFLKENSKYKADKNYEPVKKLMKALSSDLDGYDEAGKKYKTTYRDLVIKLKTELQSTKAVLATTDDELKKVAKDFEALQTKQENRWKDALAEIRKGNKDSLKASIDRTKAMEDEFALNQKLNLDIEEVKKQKGEAEENLHRRIKKLENEIDKLTKSDGGAAPAINPGSAGAQMHALLLDISQGKPLWDNPLGKITRVDLQNRQVYINLGSANGMKTEVTFNIFGAGRNGRADRELKGTIEVIRVLDGNSSLARITSIYDAEGREVAWGDAGRGRPSREAENALKEGDLLYNTFWGSRVALAGNIHFAGQSSNSPAEQMRIMAGFVHFLSRQGITVDAYLDLNDGQVKGAITNRTRYLIRGDNLEDPAKLAAPMKKEAVKEGDENKEEAPKAEGFPDRLKMINESAAKMRQEAVDKGLFVISTDNFLNVIGYRQPRSIYGEVAGFQPSAIMAAQPSANLNIHGAPPPRPAEPADEKAAEKKAPDPM